MTIHRKRSIRRSYHTVFFLCLLWSPNVFASWIDWNVNTAIPDNNETGLQDTQTLSGFGNVIQSLDVRLTFTAAALDFAYNGDFYVTLQHDSVPCRNTTPVCHDIFNRKMLVVQQ